MISDIPFEGPVGAVRVGYLDGKFVLNPTFTQINDSSIDLVVVGTKEKVVMLEAGAKEVPESLILDAIKFGQEANQGLINLQEQLREALGKPKMEFSNSEVDPKLVEMVSSIIGDRSIQQEASAGLKKEVLQKIGDAYSKGEILSALDAELKSRLRANILKKGIRPDGRGLEEVRPISCEVGLLPRTHGSGLFSRGETQVLTTTTLGSVGDEQRLDGIGVEESKRFIHHYNFSPFSTGEVRRIGTPGRREIGHGALVERAIAPVLPKEEDFAYTIRLVSEVLSSNGSTSMASVCGSNLSLMDAGVPVRAAVAGMAMGLVTGEDGSYTILTDLEGREDAYGDMDFKVAGTAQGITALQLDIKLKGIRYEILQDALHQALPARLLVLDKMRQAIGSSRPDLSRYAPRIYKVAIDPEKIGTVIGPGGKMIRSIISETKATIDIQNDGTVLIGSSSEEAAQKAIQIIEGLTKEVEVGGIHTGKVTRLLRYGAMVEILPGKEGMVHISELADYRVDRVEDIVKIGDEIMVKVIEIDRQGRTNLSRRAVFEGASETPEAGERVPPRVPPRRNPAPRPPSRPGGSGFQRRH
jgi:polyribonucleotide nucleotidyltransferase